MIDGPGQIGGAGRSLRPQDGPAIIAVPVNYTENQKLTQRLGEIEFSI